MHARRWGPIKDTLKTAGAGTIREGRGSNYGVVAGTVSREMNLTENSAAFRPGDLLIPDRGPTLTGYGRVLREVLAKGRRRLRRWHERERVERTSSPPGPLLTIA